MESELQVRTASDGLQLTLRRLASLAGGIARLALVIGIATFATGLWIFQGTGRPKWIIIGGLLCAGPVVAAALAAWRVRRTADHAPRLMDDVRGFTKGASESARVLFDYDTGQPVAMTAKNLASLRADLDLRRKDFPALAAGVKAITTVPKLVALSVLGIAATGLLGTILLIGGLID
jgi:hypothetical protein